MIRFEKKKTRRRKDSSPSDHFFQNHFWYLEKYLKSDFFGNVFTPFFLKSQVREQGQTQKQGKSLEL
jgi:hypothetical protein